MILTVHLEINQNISQGSALKDHFSISSKNLFVRRKLQLLADLDNSETRPKSSLVEGFLSRHSDGNLSHDVGMARTDLRSKTFGRFLNSADSSAFCDIWASTV